MIESTYRVPPRAVNSGGVATTMERDRMAESSTPRKPLSGYQRRKLRVAAGLPRYTPQEAASRREDDRKRTRLRVKGNLAFIQSIKMELGCSVCGYNGHPAALDFHHRDPLSKTVALSSLPYLAYGHERILEEIEKCDVLCANCHRIATHGEFARPNFTVEK